MAGHIGDMVSQHWNTPQEIVERVHKIMGGIDLDPCDNATSITGARTRYILPETDGLEAPWDAGRIYVNPPFGRDKERGTSIADWVAKCDKVAKGDIHKQIILLVPAATETMHWHEHIWKGMSSAVCFVKGRVKFSLDGKEVGSSPKGTAIVYYGNFPGVFVRAFSDIGYCLYTTSDPARVEGIIGADRSPVIMLGTGRGAWLPGRP